MSDILDDFEEIGGGEFPTAWRPEAQDPAKRSESTTLTGVYRRMESHDFGFGETNLLILEAEDGKEYSRALSGAVLPDKIKKANIREGDTVRIVYNGKKQSKSGKEYNDWSVAVKRASGDVPF